MLAENASSLRVSSSPRGSSDLFSSSNIRKTWKNLRASPTVAIGALFPYTSAGSGSSASASAVGVSSSGGNGAGNEEKRKRGRVLPITLLHALSPLYLTRHEARQKHRKLNKARDTLAERLGRLAQSVSVGALDQSSALSVQGNAADGQAASLDILKQDLVQRAGQLSQALLPVDAGNDEPPCPPSMSIEASSPLQLSAHLHELLSRTLPAHSARTRLLLSPSRLGRPSYLTRRWPIFILLPMSALLIGRAVSRNWETILQKVGDARETVTGFLVGWVYEPTLRLLDTVRHGQAEGSVIISRESLNSDLQVRD